MTSATSTSWEKESRKNICTNMETKGDGGGVDWNYILDDFM